MGGGEGQEKGDDVLEGWGEGRREGRVDERGEIACSIIAATYAGCRGWEQGRDWRRGEVVEGRGRSRGGVGGGLWPRRLSAAVKTRQSKCKYMVGCHSQSLLAVT